jgi:hypothetical protein
MTFASPTSHLSHCQITTAQFFKRLYELRASHRPIRATSNEQCHLDAWLRVADKTLGPFFTHPIVLRAFNSEALRLKFR